MKSTTASSSSFNVKIDFPIACCNVSAEVKLAAFSTKNNCVQLFASLYASHMEFRLLNGA